MEMLPALNNQDDPATPPKAMDASLRAKLSFLQNKIEREVGGRRTFAKADAPDPFVRKDLTERRDLLKTKLKASVEHVLALRILAFFRGYSEIEYWDKPKIKSKLEDYQKVLWNLPLWAFDLAVRRARDRLDPSRIPNPNELRILILSDIFKIETELRDIMEILDATVLEYRKETPEQRDAAIRRHWIEGARLTVSVGGLDELEKKKDDHERAMKEMVEGSDSLRRRWQEAKGVDPDKTVHSPFLLGQYGLLGQYAKRPPDDQADDEDENGHTHEPDRSHTA
jgi:hypothetical protein